MQIIGTARLTLRELRPGDAAFILELLNEPAWLRFIGDRGVKTLAAARDYILRGPMDMYRRQGFGLWLVALREGTVPLGICGLIKRDALDDIDLGFAFLSAHWGRGYAYEAAVASVSYGKEVLGLARIVAIASPDNRASIRLLEKLGFAFERVIQLSEHVPETSLYAVDL